MSMSKPKSLLSLINLSRPVFCVSFNSNSSLSLAQGSGSSKPSWTPLGLCTLNTLHKNILWLALPSISRINPLLSASSTTPWSISHLNNYSPCDWSSCFNSCSLKVCSLRRSQSGPFQDLNTSLLEVSPWFYIFLRVKANVLTMTGRPCVICSLALIHSTSHTSLLSTSWTCQACSTLGYCVPFAAVWNALLSPPDHRDHHSIFSFKCLFKCQLLNEAHPDHPSQPLPRNSQSPVLYCFLCNTYRLLAFHIIFSGIILIVVCLCYNVSSMRF